MKHPILFASMLLLLMMACHSVSYREEKKAMRKINTVPKEVRKVLTNDALDLFKGMRWIPGGTFTMGSADQYIAEKNDSTLLPTLWEPRVTLAGFYMSNHEVTNGEYQEFVTWVKDSLCLSVLAKHDSTYYLPGSRSLNWSRRGDIGEDDSATLAILAEIKTKPKYYGGKSIDPENLIYTYASDETLVSIAIYPDTLCFYKDFTYSFNESMTQMYFWHPKYANYPIVGLNWQQASAYCAWLNARYQQELRAAGKEKDMVLEFRLPGEAEWEYAAKSYNYSPSFENFYEDRIYPWPGLDFRDKDGKYLANFGPILDRNWMYVKNYRDDGYVYPSRVGKYPANGMGLYDMAGNVAEWTLDAPSHPDSLYADYLTDYYMLLPDHANEVREILQKTKVFGNETRDSAKQKLINRYQFYDQLYKQNQLSLMAKDTSQDNTYRRTDSPFYLMDSANIVLMAERQVDAELQYVRAFSLNPSSRIIKGGSWTSGLAYIQCGSRAIFPETRYNSQIGFRVVVARRQTQGN